MKPPKPNDGSTRHCWGKRRRAAKKLQKNLWKAMARIGLVVDTKRPRWAIVRNGMHPARAKDCFWFEEYTSGRRASRRYEPEIYVDNGPDYWGESDEYPISNVWRDYLDAKADIWSEINEDTGWPTRTSNNGPRHALQLLRREIKANRVQAQQEGGE